MGLFHSHHLPGSLACHIPVAILLSLFFLPSAKAANPLCTHTRRQDTPSPISAYPLELFTPVSKELVGGEHHFYTVKLIAGQYLRGIVEQRGIDVVVLVSNPGGRQFLKVDRPSGVIGAEGFSLIAGSDGAYTIELRSLERNATRASYEIRLEEMRGALPQDEMRIAAEKQMTEGEDARFEATAVRLRESIEKFQQGLSFWESTGERYEQAVAHYGLGLSHRSSGENSKAIHHFGQALVLMQQLGNRYGEAMAKAGLGWAYLYLGDTVKALDEFTQSLALRKGLNDLRGEGLTLYGIGWTHILLDDDEQALNSFLKLLVVRRQANDRRGEGLTLAGIGRIHNKMGRRLQALDYLQKALVILQELKHVYGEADVLSDMGWAHMGLEEGKRATQYFQQSLTLRRSLGDRIGEATTLYGLARCSSSEGDLQQARSYIEDSLQIIETLRAGVESQHLRITYFAQVQDYYKFYVDVLMRQHERVPSGGYAAEALHISERARGRAFLDLLMESGIDIRQGVGSALLQRERVLQEQMSVAADAHRQAISRKPTKEAVEASLKHIASLTNEYRAIQTKIRETSPTYASITQPKILTTAEIQQQVLDKETVLLEYEIGEESSYLWLVTTTLVKGYRLPGRTEIESAVRLVNELVTARNQSKAGETTEQKRARVSQADKAYWIEAAKLSRMLLGVAANEIQAKRLLIVPQGGLQYVPFGALPEPELSTAARKDETPAKAATTEPVPLIVNHEIVSISSASTLAVLRQQFSERKPAIKDIAIFADPVFAQDDERFESIVRSAESKTTTGGQALLKERHRRVQDSMGINRLPRLFGSRTEAQQIASLVPAGKSLCALDFQANRRAVTSAEIGEYRRLHFATHIFINDTHPELSGIALSMVDKQGRPQNGFLRAHELFNMRLSAELVVLSGCESGLGKNVKGEGLMSLTRSFMYAGAPRVVASLWSLNDFATAELIKKFYRKIFGQEGLRPAAALRQAQIEMWREKRLSAPYFWAAFILQGEWT
jgi:CHAT domain-containing protein/tetratricopeptide (TPR) repeat protein